MTEIVVRASWEADCIIDFKQVDADEWAAQWLAKLGDDDPR